MLILSRSSISSVGLTSPFDLPGGILWRTIILRFRRLRRVQKLVTDTKNGKCFQKLVEFFLKKLVLLFFLNICNTKNPMAAIKQISRVPICLSGIRSVFKRSMNCESDIFESRFWMNLLDFRISVCDGFGYSISVSISFVSISFVSISFVSISFSSIVFGTSGIKVSKSFAKRLSFLGISTVTSADVTIVDASPP